MSSQTDSKGLYDDEKVSSLSDVPVAKNGVDVVVGLVDDHSLPPDVARKLRNKLDRNLLPLLFILYCVQYIDKSSLGASSILGIMTDASLTTDEYNNLGSAFYIGYIVFVGPHAWAMQRFPIAKYIAANIFLWSVFLGLHAVCRDYGSLFALRFLLGASEGCITTGIMTITSMFYTRMETAQRIGWTFQCNGIAAIVSGFIQFGIAHINIDASPRPWKWFMVIVCVLSLVTALLYAWRMPDNPTNAVFLDGREKVDVVRRIRDNQNGVEAKVWKRYQFIEAFHDPKTYFFFLFGATSTLVNGLSVEYAIIIKGFGFSTLQTTLLNIPSGLAQIIAVTSSTILLQRWPNARTLIGAGWYAPGIVAASLLIALPPQNKVGLIVQIYLFQMSGVGLIMMLSLCAVVVSGHTKKMTVNAVFLIGYALGQILSTQFWKSQYRPRNVVPWVINLCAYVANLAMILGIRWYLARENRRRDNEKTSTTQDEFGYVEVDGVKRKVPIQYMDVTDFENRAFRYAL